MSYQCTTMSTARMMMPGATLPAIAGTCCGWARSKNFSFLSALGFVSVYMASWEFVLVSLSVGFSNGGYAGLFW